MSKHILLYTDDPGVGGVAQYNHAIVSGLVALGYQVTCVQSKSDTPLISSQKELGIQHVWLNFDTAREFGRTLTYRTDAQNILTTYKPDFIIFSDCCPFSNFAAKQVAIDLEIPYIAVIGFVAPYLAERFTAYLNELPHQYSQAQAVIAVSNENLSLLHELFRLPNNKGQVIYYGRSEQYFTPPVLSVRERLRQEFDIPSNAVVCFTAARLEAVKGYQYQLEAIKQLKQSEAWDKLYFVWVGAGNLEAQLKEAIEQLGVSSQVKLLGQRWDVLDWLDASDIFILPSELEGMPLCIMEAMAKSLPVIASAVSGIPEELGNTGKLLTDPKVEPQTTITELVTTIQAWFVNSELRQSIGQACRKRAEAMFREERMVKETMEVIECALLPDGDYVSPKFSIVLPDKCFPNMIVGDTNACPWSYLRREVPHNWYVDKRQPTVGFLSRDEAHILYNTALKFKGKKALEIGCWLGWSACHLALAGVELDVVDPLLERSEFYESVSNSLRAAGVLDSVNLISGYSPQKVEELAAQLQRKWTLIFIDGNHDAPGPLNDAIVCEQLAEADALIFFHDLASPDVAQGLDYLKQRGWNTMIYQTMQIMGVAWRGNVEPVRHQPDPKVSWQLPEHLQAFCVSTASSAVNKGIATQQVQEIMQQALALLNSGKPVEAVRMAEEAASMGIDGPGMHYIRSLCLCAVGRHREGLEAAKAELAINPKHPQAKAQVEGLTRGLSKPETNISTQQRSWNTNLPRETMLSIQLASHNYSYRGVPMIKNPFDFALYPLLIWNLKPRTIVEIGSKNGGSALWFADLLNNFSIDGHVYSIDIVKVNSVHHPRVSFMEGDGRELQAIFTLDFLNSLPRPILVIEDADHTYETSKHVLDFFHPHIREGEYIVIEDGIISDLTQDVSYNNGPHKALKEFLSAHEGKYEIDSSYCDFFGYNITWCTNGFLKKISTDSNELGQILAHVYNYVVQYQKDPTNQSTLAELRQARQEIAIQWLSLSVDLLESAYLGKLGKIHKMLLDSGIKNETLTEAEQDFVNEIAAHISSEFDDPKAINYLLTGMLYQRADQLLLQHDLTRIPNYLLNDYLQFILYAPAYFQEIGEADRYYHYMQGCLDYIHTNISSNPELKLWQEVALFFTQNANFIPLYFNSENLRDIYAKRGNIMEFALRIQGHQIDYEFPERSPERKKIRLGIIAAHFGPQTETFTALPVYKHLSRDLFEIILYTVSASNHRLERYCWGHADGFIQLPQDLASQVQTIRDGDLDIILIATNVTAVTNVITLLALHRLARVQVASTSSCVTTGIRHVDYYISGQLTEPVDNAQEHYTEKLITIDGPAHCLDLATEEQIISTISVSRESLGIGQNAVVYISGANFYKIVPEVETAWAKIISEVPNSKLVLYPFNPNWSSSYPVNYFKKRILTSFASYGLSEDRLLILEPVPNRADVKERLKIGDVYLDSYPFSGINSLIDPLEVGLPSVVMNGNSFRSLMAPALLQELQIPDLIADSEEPYVKLAIALGTNPELRKQKSDQIKQRMQANPRFLDSRAYSAQMGAVFQELFRKHQESTLADNLKLRETNLIIFPDWSQPEEVLYQELTSAIASLVNRPDKNQITLLIHLGNLSEDEASLLLSEVAMNLLLEEDLDVADGPEISFVGQLGEMQWKALLPRVQARIVLENENQEAIAALKADSIPYYGLDSFSSDINSSYRVPSQNT
jgi:predicted O-linked N-acetylglucosamine transferase (SPINDLY family)/cephalosporin hydroxylase